MGALKDIHVDPITGAARFQAGLQGLELADVVSQYGLHYRCVGLPAWPCRICAAEADTACTAAG